MNCNAAGGAIFSAYLQNQRFHFLAYRRRNADRLLVQAEEMDELFASAKHLAVTAAQVAAVLAREVAAGDANCRLADFEGVFVSGRGSGDEADAHEGEDDLCELHFECCL